jgi:CubicO group peptidase (beta-lactamase class C family)
MQNASDSVAASYVDELYNSKTKEVLLKQLYASSLTLASNGQSQLPLKYIRNDSLLYVLHVGEDRMKAFDRMLPNYTLFRSSRQRVKAGTKIKAINAKHLKRYDPVIITLEAAIDPTRDSAFVQSVLQLQKATNVTLINYGNSSNLKYLNGVETVVQSYGNSDWEQELGAQLVFGGVPAKGFLPMHYDSAFAYHSGEQQERAVRLQYVMPEEVGICADSLKRIDFIAQTVIQRRATPGMQILIAKQGKVFYHKAFGYHTYSKKRLVSLTDIYDLASLTKTTSTTLAAMRMYEQKKFKLSDSLKDYLPDTLKFTSLNDVTFKQILTHRTGLSSGMNILKFLQYTNDSVGQFDRYFCDWPDDSLFKVQIADSIWMDTTYADSIWVDLTSQWIDKSRPYKYSDANFNLLYFMLRSMAEEALYFDKYVHKEFYKPLGLQTMGYLPLERFPLSRIPPTEDEKYWRRQLLQGYVHDPTAALMGGVAGNAGLFSNANDMAIVYQMLLNGGEYGGKRYFEESTVKLFTEKANNGHRGLGFNKPSPGARKGIIAPGAPMASFGHTGFTGICAWVDPENELVYIFISNRVHPKSMNKKLVQNGTRKRIHQVIYDQILPKEIVPVLDSLATDTNVVAVN